MSAGLYDDDGKIVQRARQRQSPLNRSDDDDEDASGMFQANYQYTPLKDYAAVRSRATSNDSIPNGYRGNDSKFDVNTQTG
jgi:hypothetical protein